MKEIKFTTKYEPVLFVADKEFKEQYNNRVGDNSDYKQKIDGEVKYLAVCPRCNNPVVILGIFKKIRVAPHARHAKGISIPNVAQYDEYKFLHCPYHRKKADYIREYVPETEEPQRQELYRIAKEHYDKAIYLLQKYTGIRITKQMMENLAENYAEMRVYNYIDATIYNIPWYLVYGFDGFQMYHMIVRKDTTLYRHLRNLGFVLRDSRIQGHVYIENNESYLLKAVNYRYVVDKNDNLEEWLDFSILRPDETVIDTLLYVAVDRFSIPVDSYYFGNLVNYKDWKPNQLALEIAKSCMNP